MKTYSQALCLKKKIIRPIVSRDQNTGEKSLTEIEIKILVGHYNNVQCYQKVSQHGQNWFEADLFVYSSRFKRVNYYCVSAVGLNGGRCSLNPIHMCNTDNLFITFFLNTRHRQSD